MAPSRPRRAFWPSTSSSCRPNESAGRKGPRCVYPLAGRRGRSEARPARSAASRATGAATAATARTAHDGLRLHRQEALALHALAGKLAGPADRLRLLPRLLLGWFLVVAAQLHFAEDALTLHFLLERLEGLIDVIVPDENLHAAYLFE